MFSSDKYSLIVHITSVFEESLSRPVNTLILPLITRLSTTLPPPLPPSLPCISPQRKELGVLVYNCSCLAIDLHRVFSFYWQLQNRDYVPSIWSKRVTALYGKDNPVTLYLNDTEVTAYVSVRILCYVLCIT